MENPSQVDIDDLAPGGKVVACDRCYWTGDTGVVHKNVDPSEGGFGGCGGALHSLPVGLVAALGEETVAGHQRPGSALHFGDIHVPDRHACTGIKQTFDNRQTDPLRPTRDHCHPLRKIMLCFVDHAGSPFQIVVL